jgi:hypothetical protein
MSKGKSIRLKKSDVGRWITVRWDDIGRVDCLLVEHFDDGTHRVFSPINRSMERIDSPDQVTEVRDFVNAK